MKKLISLVLAISMLISLAPTFAFATEDTTQTSNIITLFDFGNTATFSTADYHKNAATPSAFAYEGKESSMKWEMIYPSSGEVADTAPELDMRYTDQDLSNLPADATINVRFYSEAAGSKFNLVYLGSELGEKFDLSNDGTADEVTYYKNSVTIDGGWQVHSMSLKTAMAKFRNYAEDKKIVVRFNDEGWSNLKDGCYNDGDTVYIDEIWVDSNPEVYYDSLDTDSNKVVWTSADGINTNSAYTTGLVASLDNERNVYTKVCSTTTKDMKLATSAHINSDGYLFDSSSTSAYKYLNAWIYSEKAQDAGIVLNLITTDSKNNRYGIEQLDWTGWKLVSVNLEDDIYSGDSSNRGQISSISIQVDSWKNQAITNLPEIDNNGDGKIDVVFGIDGVWVSETSAQAEWEMQNSVVATSPVTPASTDYFTVDFNNAASLINPSTTHGNTETKSLNANINRYNKRVYDVNARLSFSSLTFSNIQSMSVGDIRGFVSDNKMAMLQLKEATTTDLLIVPTTAYVNAWIYNPEPKYTFDGTTPADFVIALAKYQNNAHSNTFIAVPADWTGWKLVSIPITKWGDYSDSGISHAFIATNYGRLPLTEGDDGKCYPKIASTGIRKLSNSSPQNVFSRERACTVSDNVVTAVTTSQDNKNVNLYNYIDVERVWISEGAPKGAGTIVAEDNSALKCFDDGKVINLFTSDNEPVKTDINVIKNIDGVVSKVDGATISNGKITLPSFEYGADYSVYADIYGEDANVEGKEFTFTTEDIHIGDMEITSDGKTATITMHGNLGEYEEAIIVAAVYTNSSKNELSTAYVGDSAADGIATVTIPLDAVDKNCVSFFFFDSIGNIKPLVFDLQK